MAIHHDVDQNGSAAADGHANGSASTPQTTALADVPVLIIGGGPVGLLQAYLLSRLGVQTLLVERYPKRLGAPKAHALSPRSLEICRQFGLDMEHIRSLGSQRDDAYWVNFLTTLTGPTLGRLPYERMDPAVLDCTPEMIHNISQPDFEQYINDELSKQNNAEIRKGVSFVSLNQHGDSVTTLVEERATGKLFTVRSRFVIACDGAKSDVRDYLGIESDGEDSYETMMTIHFSANLRSIVGDRVGMLHWLFDPMASGFIIAYDLSGNAVLITNFDSEKYPVESWNEDLCRKFLQGAIGRDEAPKILSYRPWILSRRVAKSYRKGNVFLAGDAAHAFPPTGGLGLNSGLADAHNLAFKIAAVSQGKAQQRLLDSYEAERRHVAEVNSRQSVKNGQMIFKLLKTLGTAGISDLEQARRNLAASMKDPATMDRVEAGVEEQREHFDNLNLHIGYVYGDTSIPDHASHFEASFQPGARLPHAWLCSMPATIQGLKPVNIGYVRELPSAEIQAKTFSTLDLCAPDAWTFLLPLGVSALDEVADSIITSNAELKFNTFKLVKDFYLLPGAAGEDWLQKSGLQSDCGLLIRPDQHIFRALDRNTEEHQLAQALGQFLGTS